MIPRWLLTTLVFALPILVVTFGVVLGAAGLAGALGDVAGRRVLHGVGVVTLILLVMDLLLLVGVLGIQALEQRRDEEGP